ncbi:uroporphyrinogen-III synthase [Rhodosalinus sp.]|uniref:uroporphyrinogen-III synthase n=1 Tax=Rhodosalinus sp. TaxID=2047741 RepID=UPI003979616D
MTGTPTLLLTRPAEASERFAAQLRGVLGARTPKVLIAPLMRLDYAGRLPEMTRVAGLIFTSANGVRAYAVAGGPRDLPAWAVGDATAEAARRAGIPARAAGGDARALLDLMVRERPPGPLLHVRGEHARGDVARKLRVAGLDTRETVLYRQILLPLGDAARAALEGRAPVVVPLFSPRTAVQFATQHGGRAPLLVAAMSEAVAREVAHLPAVRLLTAERPDAPAMLRAVVALLDHAARLEGPETDG